MRRHGRITLLASAVLAAVGVFLSSAGRAAPPPERIESTKPAIRSAPVWVSADQALDGAGGLVWEFFTPGNREDLERAMALYRELRAQGLKRDTSDPCRSTDHGYADYYVPDPTLEDLFKHSEVIFNGTVQGRAQGFYLGAPSTLYSVQIDKVWSGSHATPADKVVFVALPEATIDVGNGTWLCARTTRSPDHPEVGRRILIFSDREPPWPPIFNPMDEELFFETAKAVSMPDHFGRDPERELLSDIDKLIAMLRGSR